MPRLVFQRVRNILLDLEGVRRAAENPVKIAGDLSTTVVIILATTVQAQLGDLSEEDLIRECRKRIFRLRRDVGGQL